MCVRCEFFTSRKRERPGKAGCTRRFEKAKSVRRIEPPVGAGWLSARNRALRFRLVKERRGQVGAQDRVAIRRELVFSAEPGASLPADEEADRGGEICSASRLVSARNRLRVGEEGSSCATWARNQ